MDKHLHIVCLDIPYPPDYGGAFVMFYDIKTLHEAGVKIHLHCFEYGRGKQAELNQYCEEVQYYSRKRSLTWLFTQIPYIVASRKNSRLLQNLSRDNYPVLIEGIHCTGFVKKAALKNRQVWVRLHNVEWQYYEQLAKSSKNSLRKIYFLLESKLLKKYEKRIAENPGLLALNERDKRNYEKFPHATHIHFLPVFIPSKKVSSLTGKGSYCLYHGNLSVAENEKAVLWLLKEVINDPDIPFVIAGKNPSALLRKKVQKLPKVTLVANPTAEEMMSLIREAHIHLLPSFNTTGIKIKLINALQNGRFVIANPATAEGMGLEGLCEVVETPEETRQAISKLFQSSFTEGEKEIREAIMGKVFDNETNVQKLLNYLFHPAT